jgi:hypothetical protein
MLNDVCETTMSTGCGAFALSVCDGSRSFYSTFGSGGDDVFLYLIRHRTTDEWEVGTGHLSDAATLVRDTVVASSNHDAPVNFSPGTKDILNNIYGGVYE